MIWWYRFCRSLKCSFRNCFLNWFCALFFPFLSWSFGRPWWFHIRYVHWVFSSKERTVGDAFHRGPLRFTILLGTFCFVYFNNNTIRDVKLSFTVPDSVCSSLYSSSSSVFWKPSMSAFFQLHFFLYSLRYFFQVFSYLQC
jgi:hypothetical protein